MMARWVYRMIGCFLATATAATARAGETTLWYDRPAKQWNEALPVGNGRLGAMVFGGVEQEHLQLNEETVWSGNRSNYDRVGAFRHLPEVRRLLFAGKPAEANALVTREILGDRPLGAYQPLGDLVLNLPGGEVANYRRELDLDTAVLRVTYQQNGARFTREVFASAPANVIVVRLTCDRPARIALSASLSRKEGAASESTRDGLVLRGQADQNKPTQGVQFVAQLKALPEGGSLRSDSGTLHVESANAVTLLLSAETDFRGETDPGSAASLPLDLAAEKTYDVLRDEHVADHRRLFRRVAIELGDDAEASKLPTDRRVQRVRDGATDSGLVELYFQYGRYLLISSSRPGNLAANLQGIWNDDLAPPWFCGWHLDVNAQMNYWPAEVANLSECHEPLFDLIENLRANGRRTAKDVYNCRGFVVAHRTNANFFTSPVKGFNVWPPGAAWLCQHLWERYRFTQDREFLERKAYPLMKESAEFFLDWLVEDPKTGKLVSGPSLSPENSFLLPDKTPQGLCMGPAMDQQIVAELFDNCLEAAAILGIDDEFVRGLKAKRQKLEEGKKIGSDGRLMEWAEEYPEREPGHRHVSHLYAVYPGWQITPRGTPELAAAARKSLVHRISGGRTTKKVNISDSSNVGWSLAWNIGLWSRLGDASQAHQGVVNLLRRCTFPNLFDFHPRANTPGVFQIDGNFGATAGICEMLLQSHTGEIELMPALPTEWPAGKVAGLRARGAVGVDLEWAEGKLKHATLRPEKDGAIKLRLGEKVVEVPTKAGETVTVDGQLNRVSQ